MTKKLLRLSTWLVVSIVSIVLLAAIGAGFYTRTEHFRSLARTQTITALQGVFDGDIALEQVSGSVWTELVLHNFSVQQNGVVVLSLPQLVLQIDLLAQVMSFLGSSAVHVTKVQLDAPTITLVEDQKGWNISHLLKPSEEPEEPTEPSSLTIYLDHVTIKDGRIAAKQANGADTQVNALMVDGSVALLASGTQVDLTTCNFSLKHDGLPEVTWNSALAYNDAVTPAVIRLQNVALRTPKTLVHLSGTVEDLTTPNAELTLDIENLAAEELRALVPDLPLQQDLSGTIHATGPFSALQVAATLKTTDAQLTTTATADLSQTPPRFQGSAEVQRFVAEKVLRIDGFRGTLSGQVTFSWATLETAQSTLRAHAAGLRVQGWDVGNLDLDVNLRKGQLGMTADVQGASGNARLRSDVTLGAPQTYEATLQVKNFNVAKVTQDTAPMTGRLNLEAWVKGRGMDVASMDTAVKLTVLPSQIGPVAIKQGRVAGMLRHGRLTLDELMLLANDTTVNVQGQLGSLQDTPDGKLTYTLSVKNLVPWLTLAGQKGQGSLEVRGTASGTLAALDVAGAATLSNIRLDTLALRRGTLDYNVDAVGGATPQGKLTVVLDRLDAGMLLRSVNADVVFTGVDPAEVRADVTVLDAKKQTHRLKTHARYQPERIDVLLQELALQLPSGVWQTAQPSRFVMEKDTLTVSDFLFQRAQQTLTINGSLTLQGPRTQDLHLQVHRLALEEFRPLLPTDVQIQGEITADVHVRGTPTQPQIETTLRTNRLTIAGQQYAGLTVENTCRQGQCGFTLRFLQDAQHSLSVVGSIPLLFGWGESGPPLTLGDVDVRARSDGLSLAFLSAFSKDVQEVDGALGMDVHVRGPFAALIPNGTVWLRQGKARVVPLGLTYKDIEVELGVTPNLIRVIQLVAHTGKGQLSGTGEITLRQLQPTALDIAIKADNFRAIRTREYEASVSGQITASGSPEHPVVRGALDIHDATLRPDLTFLNSGPAAQDTTIIVAQNTQELKAYYEKTALSKGASNDKQAPPPDVYRQLSLDVAITIARGTWMHLDDGSVELTGRLKAQKKQASEDLKLTGTIETVRGWYAFQGRKFRFETGQIVFTGGKEIDPSLDIVARYTLPNYKVDVAVVGTASAPELILRSEPTLEQADILSLLAFGRPVNQLSEGEKTSLQSKALQMTASYVAADLRRSVANKLGLDNLEVDVGQNLAESRVGAGKQVGEKTFISTSRSLGGKQEQEVAIEYHLNSNWQLKTSTTTRGDNGIDLFWEKKY